MASPALAGGPRNAGVFQGTFAVKITDSPSHSLFYRGFQKAGPQNALRVSLWSEEDDMRNGLVVAIAGLGFLAGCGNWGNKPYDVSAAAKWKIPYHIEFDTKAAPSNPSGLTLPAVIYTANPKAIERRASLVVRFDASGVKGDKPGQNQIIMSPFDVPGSAGSLSATTMDLVNGKVAKLLVDRCVNGKVKLTLALVRSSIKPDATEAEINAKRLSDWITTEVVFKNPRSKKC